MGIRLMRHHGEGRRGVWLLRGDTRKAMNIYFLEDGDGVVQFDAGTKAMAKRRGPRQSSWAG